MQERVRATIVTHRMLTPGDRVIVAVSGGPDSVALLHLLHRLAPEWAAGLHVFHMEHGLRGEASRADAAYVRELAEQLGLPCTVFSLQPGVLKHQSGSLQANARAARHSAIEQLALETGANRVAVGHHRDDQAETFLLRLLRGAGARGLGSMAPVRSLGGLAYIRPLLELSRAEIEAYCTAHSLAPRQDKSNMQPDYLRNRIRLDLLPKLALEYNPAIARNLAQTASLLRAEDDFLDALAAEGLDRCRLPGADVTLATRVLLREPAVLARRVIRLAARAVAGEAFDLGAEPVARVLDAAARTAGTHELDLPGGLKATFMYGSCRFTMAVDSAPPACSTEWPVLLKGRTELPELGLAVEAGGPGHPSGPWEASFDPEALPGSLAVRLRQPGDRIWPTGMEGSKKLQDILVDAKVPRWQRDRVPLLTAGDQVLWVIGYRLDRRFLATAATQHPILIRVAVLPDALEAHRS